MKRGFRPFTCALCAFGTALAMLVGGTQAEGDAEHPQHPAGGPDLTLPKYPFQEGSSLNAANIDYTSLKAMAAMKRLNELEALRPPAN